MDFSDQCTLNSDGTLKDASEIVFDHSPTQATSALPLVTPPSPTVSKPAGARLIFKPYVPPAIASSQKANPTQSLAPVTVKISTQKAKKAAMRKTKPTKSVPLDRIRADNGLHTMSVSTDTTPAASDDNNEGLKRKRKKGGSSRDILTIFSRVDDDNVLKGYQCNICM